MGTFIEATHCYPRCAFRTDRTFSMGFTTQSQHGMPHFATPLPPALFFHVTRHWHATQWLQPAVLLISSAIHRCVGRAVGWVLRSRPSLRSFDSYILLCRLPIAIPAATCPLGILSFPPLFVFIPTMPHNKEAGAYRPPRYKPLRCRWNANHCLALYLFPVCY